MVKERNDKKAGAKKSKTDSPRQKEDALNPACGGLVASGRAYHLRILLSSSSTCWPLFFGNTAEWPKITQVLP